MKIIELFACGCILCIKGNCMQFELCPIHGAKAKSSIVKNDIKARIELTNEILKGTRVKKAMCVKK